MSFEPTRFYQGQPGTSDNIIGSVDNTRGAILKEVVITNTSGSSATLSLSVLPDVATPPANSAVRLFDAYSVTAHDTKVFALSTVLNDGDGFWGFQGTSNALVVTISGVLL